MSIARALNAIIDLLEVIAVSQADLAAKLEAARQAADDANSRVAADLKALRDQLASKDADLSAEISQVDDLTKAITGIDPAAAPASATPAEQPPPAGGDTSGTASAVVNP